MRERWLGKWAFSRADSTVDQAGNDVVLAEIGIVTRDRASRTVLTQRAVDAFVATLDMMAVRGRNTPLTPQQRTAFAGGVVSAYQQAPAADKLRIASSESRYLQLRANLERSTPVQQAEFRRQMQGVSDGPGLVRLAYGYMNVAEDPAAPRVAGAGGGCNAGWMCDEGAVHLWAKANAMALLNPHL